MEFSDKIVSAFIAAAVSLIAAIVTVRMTTQKFKEEKEKLKTEIEHRYIEQLYEKRIAFYPKAFELAGKIKKKKKPEGINSPEELYEIKKSLE